jgi:D-lactate dehydrogenase (cytochrome)
LSTTTEPKHDVSPATLQAAWAEFKNIIGEDNISTSQAEVKSHSGSEWSTYASLPGDVPFAVLKPASTEEVSEIMKVCHRRAIPVTAYSGGTSLEGHFAATRGGICIDFSRMDKVLALHKEDLDVVVQPAVGWQDLNEDLAKDGLFFPPDPGPGAMIGGMIGTGCSGTNAYRYGTMKDWVLSLTVVLADGTVIKTKQRPRKSSAGYDLTRTFIGSEGTLGLVTEATLKLTPTPDTTSVAVCTFPTIRDAANCVFGVVGASVPVAAVEILDDVQMKCINDAGSTSRHWQETPTLFFKFAGTPAAVKEHVAMVQKLAKQSQSKSFEFARSANEAEELWQARKEALWSVMAKKQNADDSVWTTDVAVPMSRMADIIDETKRDISRSGLTGSIVGHVGDGNFHAIILYNKAQHSIAEELVHRMVKRAIEMEGTATGEHGVGLVKRDYLPHEVGQTTVDLMRKVSSKFPNFATRRLLSKSILTTYPMTDENRIRPKVSAQLRQGYTHAEAGSGRGYGVVGEFSVCNIHVIGLHYYDPFPLPSPLHYTSTYEFQSGVSFPIGSCMTLTTRDNWRPCWTLPRYWDSSRLEVLASARYCQRRKKGKPFAILTVVWQSKSAG